MRPTCKAGMLGNHWVSEGTKSVLFKYCYLATFGLTFISIDLKLSHQRFREKWKVFEILGRVLLGVVVAKLRLEKRIFYANASRWISTWRL